MTEQRALVQASNLAPTTFKEAQEFASQICKTDFVPAAFRGNPGAVLAAIQYGAEVGLAPLAALQNIAVINGKPSLYGDAVPAVCMAHPDFVSMKEDFDDATMTATCTASRKGNPPFIGKFSKADAEAAGLWGKPGPWKQYPKRMLQMRARGFALRDAFPDALKGLVSREEAEDYAPIKEINPKDETPPPSAPHAGQAQASNAGAPQAEGDSTDNPAPYPMPSPPADPEDGEKGIMPDAWTAAVDFGVGCKDGRELAEWFTGLQRAYGKTKARPEPIWTEAQLSTLIHLKDEMKLYLGLE